MIEHQSWLAHAGIENGHNFSSGLHMRCHPHQEKRGMSFHGASVRRDDEIPRELGMATAENAVLLKAETRARHQPALATVRANNVFGDAAGPHGGGGEDRSG